MRRWWGRRVGQQSGAWQQEEEHTWMSSGHALLDCEQTAPHTQPCLAAESPPVPSCGFSRPISSRSSVLLPAPGRNGASVLRSFSVTSGRMQQAAAACATACTRRGCRRSSGPAACRQHQAVEPTTHERFQRWPRAHHARSPRLQSKGEKMVGCRVQELVLVGCTSLVKRSAAVWETAPSSLQPDCQQQAVAAQPASWDSFSPLQPWVRPSMRVFTWPMFCTGSSRGLQART